MLETAKTTPEAGLPAQPMNAKTQPHMKLRSDEAGHVPMDLPNPDPEPDAVSSEAAEAVIEAKRIGDRIKHLRQRKHMGLVELGRHTGLSASFLSQLETGRVVPTLRNLARIAMVFSRHLSYFFEPERGELFRIVRAEDRQRLPESGIQAGTEEPRYYFESLGQVPSTAPDGTPLAIAPYVAEFLPATAARPARAHRHAGREFLYMLDGRMKLTHDGQSEALCAGDAVYFDADSTHSYEADGTARCTALILTLPDPGRNGSGPRAMKDRTNGLKR